jgi:ferredoxin/flavodoxin---NADP+ reductase
MTEQHSERAAALRVAIIGSGPSAFYAADSLLSAKTLTAFSAVYVDMFERLPTPFGLVRGGVAPDHPKIKSVVKVYDKTASNPHFRFFGHVDFGTDITHDELMAHYHAVIYAVGAQSDRKMGIEGEDLHGSHAATEFVAWYNGHPDYQTSVFDLSQKAAAVIGNGNVAMDVARILAKTPHELAETDITDAALNALAHSAIEDIYVIGRRGAAQAAFTTPELKELGELDCTDVIVSHEDAQLDPLSAADSANFDRTVSGNLETLAKYAAHGTSGKPRRLHLRFLQSPTRLIGTDRVEAIELVKNELVRAEDGSLRARATDHTEIIPVGLVFRSIGYMGVPLEGVPFEAKKGVIRNMDGRVCDDADQVVRGEYCVGWIKRGPSGVIGTNKPDSVGVVALLIEDANAGRLNMPASTDPHAILDLLDDHHVEIVTYADWQKLDALEQEAGKAQNRPRVKFTNVDEMMRVVKSGM